MEKSGSNYYYLTTEKYYWPNFTAESTREEILSPDDQAVIAGGQYSSPYYRGLTNVPDDISSSKRCWLQGKGWATLEHFAATKYNDSSSTAEEAAFSDADIVTTTRAAPRTTARFFYQHVLHDEIQRQIAGEDFMHLRGHHLNMITDYSDESIRHDDQQNPEVRIDIEWVENDVEQRVRQSDHHLTNFNKLKFEKSRLLFEDRLYETMRETTLALGGQAVGAVMTNALLATSSSSSSSSWAVWLSEIAVALGLCFIMAGISTRVRRPSFSILMTKFGAIATSSAIIISLGSHLPPVMAWMVAPVAFFIVAAAVAFA